MIEPAGKDLFWLLANHTLLKYNVKTRIVEVHPVFQPSGKKVQANPTTMYTLANGNLCVGTANHMAVLDQNGKLIREIYWENSKQGENVFTMEQDRQGNIWFVTIEGLCKYDASADTVFRFGNETILRNIPVGQHAMVMAGENLLIGYQNRVVKLNTRQMDQYKLFPKLCLNSFILHNQKLAPGTKSKSGEVVLDKSIAYKERLKLPYFNNNIAFNLSVIQYPFGRKNSYAYRLLGLNDLWIHGDSDHPTINYTDLKPGNYTLQLKVSNPAGEWSGVIKQMEITITPPFWQTLWFRGLVLAMIIFLLYLGYKIRVAQLQAQKRRLEETVKERTREIEMQKENCR